jgi:hypothetical protein
MRVGRNDRCPCGSGKKFKHCHLNMPPIGAVAVDPRPLPREVMEKFDRHRREETLREANFGKIRPIIQVPEYAGRRIVVVRGTIYYQDKEKWKFFSDFLLDYSKLKFGKEWLDAQNAASPGPSSSLRVAAPSLRAAAAAEAPTRWHLRRDPKRPDGCMQQLLLRSLHG